MKILCASDSFKGSLTSYEAGLCIKAAAERIFEDPQVDIITLADGGEGTTAALASAMGGVEREIFATSPIMNRKCKCKYAYSGKTAIIEMAAAAGLTLISEPERDPMHTTTFGVGEMIKDAISLGCRDFIIGLGGSATNDCGIGMLASLGYEFKDIDGNDRYTGAEDLGKVEYISAERHLPTLDECTFTVACDVKNPLCGENGCSAVYAPQKGACHDDIPIMDKYIDAFAQKADKLFGTDYRDKEGSGAAGGVGYALFTFLNAKMVSGIDLILEKSGAEERIKNCDFVITGEGKLDRTSVMGKAPVGVARLAKKYSKPVIAFCGCCGEEASRCNDEGIDAYFPILRDITTLDNAMKTAYAKKNLTDTAEQVLRLYNIKK